MTDVPGGLIVATPIIIVFAVVLNRLGVLQRVGALTAVVFSVATAAALILNQWVEMFKSESNSSSNTDESVCTEGKIVCKNNF
jgi:hypothetical protein